MGAIVPERLTALFLRLFSNGQLSMGDIFSAQQILNMNGDIGLPGVVFMDLSSCIYRKLRFWAQFFKIVYRQKEIWNSKGILTVLYISLPLLVLIDSALAKVGFVIIN